MENDTTATAWHTIKEQIQGLRIETQIDDLRRRLSEDWYLRASRRKTDAAAAESVYS